MNEEQVTTESSNGSLNRVMERAMLFKSLNGSFGQKIAKNMSINVFETIDNARNHLKGFERNYFR